MKRIMCAIALACGVAVCAKTEDAEVLGTMNVYNYDDCKVCEIRDSPNSFPGALFASVDPNEKFEPAQKYGATVNVFMIESKADKRRVLVDSGFGAPRGRMLGELEQAGIAPDTISDILVTHIHPDHIGALKSFPKANVHIARAEYDSWKADASMAGLAQFLPAEKELDLFEYGTEPVPGFKALKFAGHTPGHTVYQMGNVFFAGDILHALDLQLAHPNFCARFDRDPKMAVESRKELLGRLKPGTEMLGAHFGGRVSKQSMPGKE